MGSNLPHGKDIFRSTLGYYQNLLPNFKLLFLAPVNLETRETELLKLLVIEKFKHKNVFVWTSELSLLFTRAMVT